MWAEKQHWTPHFHTPDSTDSLPVHISQLIQCSTRSGMLLSLEFSGKGAQGSVDARTLTSTPAASWGSRDTAGTCCSCSVHSQGEDWILENIVIFFFIPHHTDAKNQFFIFVFRGSTSFFFRLFGSSRNDTGFLSILRRRIYLQNRWFAFSDTKPLTWVFKPVEEVVVKAAQSQSVPIRMRLESQPAQNSVLAELW